MPIPRLHLFEFTDQSAVALSDADHDGMPDEWELRHKLNPRDASDTGTDPDGGGYTNIEE
jgi:hypothetical protein